VDCSKLNALATAMDAFSDYAVAHWSATMNTTGRPCTARRILGGMDYQGPVHTMSLAETGLSDAGWGALATPVKNARRGGRGHELGGNQPRSERARPLVWSPDPRVPVTCPTP